MTSDEEQNYIENLNQARAVSCEINNLADMGVLEYMGTKININTKLPKSPSLPVIMFLLAILKDTIDIGLTILVVLSFGLLLILTIIFGTIISIIFGVIIGVWVTQKVGIVRKLLFKKVIIRIIVFMFLGSIPFLKIFPEATLLVLLTYLNEVKIVNGLFEAMEKVTGKIKII